jgi:hypothetical protein
MTQWRVSCRFPFQNPVAGSNQRPDNLIATQSHSNHTFRDQKKALLRCWGPHSEKRYITHYWILETNINSISRGKFGGVTSRENLIRDVCARNKNISSSAREQVDMSARSFSENEILSHEENCNLPTDDTENTGFSYVVQRRKRKRGEVKTVATILQKPFPYNKPSSVHRLWMWRWSFSGVLKLRDNFKPRFAFQQ